MSKKYPSIIWNTTSVRPDKTLQVCEKINYEMSAPERGINMLLAKVHQQAFTTEVKFTEDDHHRQAPPKLVTPLAQARIAFVSDGGLVPKGNPDHLPPLAAEKYCVYPLPEESEFTAKHYAVVHQGYEHAFVEADPNRLIPLDVAREAVKRQELGALDGYFYSTVGVMTKVERAIEMGKSMAQDMLSRAIDAVIISSTCGTSTRCGAHIACELEQAGLPVVHVTNLIHISEWIGCSRILKGGNVNYVFGNPNLSAEREKAFRQKLFLEALDLLTRD